MGRNAFPGSLAKASIHLTLQGFRFSHPPSQFRRFDAAPAFYFHSRRRRVSPHSSRLKRWPADHLRWSLRFERRSGASPCGGAEMPLCDDRDVGFLTKCSAYYYNFYDCALPFLLLVMRCFLIPISLLTLLCQTVRAQSVFAHVIVCLRMRREVHRGALTASGRQQRSVHRLQLGVRYQACRQQRH